jgi:hypothetical protein
MKDRNKEIIEFRDKLTYCINGYVKDDHAPYTTRVVSVSNPELALDLELSGGYGYFPNHDKITVIGYINGYGSGDPHSTYAIKDRTPEEFANIILTKFMPRYEKALQKEEIKRKQEREKQNVIKELHQSIIDSNSNLNFNSYTDDLIYLSSSENDISGEIRIKDNDYSLRVSLKELKQLNKLLDYINKL